MAKVNHRVLLIIITLLVGSMAFAQTTYTVQYHFADSSGAQKGVALDTAFTSRILAETYIAKLPATLQSKGFITASVDSVQFDSLTAAVQLFIGGQYKWAKIDTHPADEDLLNDLRWSSKLFSDAGINFTALQAWQEKIINYLEENGHPFAKVYLDSIDLNGNEVKAMLNINRGPVYKIDSIRVYGDANVSNFFLQRHLNIYNGSLYNRKKLMEVTKKLTGLTYIQEEYLSNLTMLGTGSVLNLYLKPKRSSQVNVLFGFLPNSTASLKSKFQFTVDADILLRNALSRGETIGLTWQKLQPQSQQLNLLYEQPFIFKSPLGLNFSFDMFRKDSTFLNIDMRLGAIYRLGSTQTTTLFIQRRQTIVDGINTVLVTQTKRLPQEADVNSVNVGAVYDYNTTDYRFNPRKGLEFTATASLGQKKIRKNNQVVALKDPGNPSFKYESLYDTVKLSTYQIRVVAAVAKYFSLGGQSTVKAAVNGGFYGSGNTFRNELFQIGGYRLLRGFNEESQYVSHYSIGTVEYRYLIGQNSAFFAFADGGWAKHLVSTNNNHTYVGTGVGIALETKAGIFNLVWALGKRDDTDFNLRQSKVHLGFASFF